MNVETEYNALLKTILSGIILVMVFVCAFGLLDSSGFLLKTFGKPFQVDASQIRKIRGSNNVILSDIEYIPASCADHDYLCHCTETVINIPLKGYTGESILVRPWRGILYTGFKFEQLA